MKKLLKVFMVLIFMSVVAIATCLITVEINNTVNPGSAWANSEACEEFEKQIAQLEQELETTKEQLSEEEALLKQTQEKIEEAKKLLELYSQSDIEGLQRTLEEKQAQLEQLQQENAELLKRLDEALTEEDKQQLEQQIAENTNQLAQTEETVKTIKQLITDGENTVEEIQKTLEELEQQSAIMEANIPALKEKSDNIFNQIEIFQDQIHALTHSSVTDIKVGDIREGGVSYVVFNGDYCIQWGYQKDVSQVPYTVDLAKVFGGKDYLVLVTLANTQTASDFLSCAVVIVGEQTTRSFSVEVDRALGIVPGIDTVSDFYWIAIGELDAVVGV